MSSAETTEHAQSRNVPTTVIFSATLGKFVETIGKWGASSCCPCVHHSLGRAAAEDNDLHQKLDAGE